MNRDTAKDMLKERLTDYVGMITKNAHGGKYVYICPLCGSGSGKNGTAAFNINRHDLTQWKCFSCEKGGDIFDLIGEFEGLTGYSAQFARACELFGITADTETPTPPPKPKQETCCEIEVPKDYSEYCRRAAEHIEETDYWKKRGLSLETVKRFGIGYDAEWRSPKNPNARPSTRLIIPTDTGEYIARATDPGDNYRYMNSGSIGLFHAARADSDELRNGYDCRLYVVEGAIDAMSIAEMGGDAVALNSVSNWEKVLPEIIGGKYTGRYAHIYHTRGTVIIALDNDARGQETAQKLLKQLTDNRINAVIYNPSGDYKDPNEALKEDREGFKAAVWYGMTASSEDLKKFEDRRRYKRNAVSYHIQDFLNGIAESAGTPPTPTGFKALDEVLDGGLYEGLYFIGAISSLGKTTLVMQIADQIAQSGRDVLVFSLEMARSELMSKSISRLTMLRTISDGGDTKNAKTARGITAGMRYLSYSQTERDLINEAVKDYAKYAEHIYIHEGVGDIGAAQIRQAVETHVQITGAKPVVVVDYLQILAPYDVRATDKQNTDKAVLELKRLSRDYKLPVIGISSFNRENYDTGASMKAFKESGSIEYSCDVLFGLQLEGMDEKGFDVNAAKQNDPRRIELVVLKNRNGATGGKVRFSYYPRFNLYMEA